jgi:hypothetical protein
VKPARLSTLLAALGIAAGSQGCSASGPSIETFVERYSEDFCNRVYDCCAPEQARLVALIGHSPSTAAACAQAVRKFQEQNIHLLRARQAPLDYHADRAQGCLDRVAAMTCAELVQARAQTAQAAVECEGIFHTRRSRPLDAPCSSTEGDCAQGLHCRTSAGDALNGVCRPDAEIPSVCPACPPPTSCRVTDVATCVQRAPEGASCTDGFECASGLCWRPTDGAGTCGLPAGSCALH